MFETYAGNTAKYTILMGSLTFVSSIVCCLWFNKEAIIAGVVLALTFIGFVYKKVRESLIVYKCSESLKKISF